MRQKLGKLMIIVAIYILVSAGFLLYRNIDDYKENETVVTKLQEDVIRKEVVKKQDGNREIEIEEYYIDWEKLKDTDVVGWIRFENKPEVIDYPIVKGETNDTYIHHLYTGEYNYGGSIFMNCENSSLFTDTNTILYGHNMYDGSMFHDLRYFLQEDYMKTNGTLYIYLPDGTKHTYEVFSASYVMDGG